MVQTPISFRDSLKNAHRRQNRRERERERNIENKEWKKRREVDNRLDTPTHRPGRSVNNVAECTLPATRCRIRSDIDLQGDTKPEFFRVSSI